MSLTKYSLWTSFRSILCFLAIYIPIQIVSSLIIVFNITDTSIINGFDMTSTVYVLVLSIALFVECFKMAMANSDTRKNVILSCILTAVPVSLVLTAINSLLFIISNTISESSSLFFMLYSEKYGALKNSLEGILMDALFEMIMLITVFLLGYLISVIFYRLDKLGKLIFSVAFFGGPILLIPTIDKMFFNSTLIHKLFSFIGSALGLTTCNPLMAIMSMTIVSAVLLLINYILISGAKLKKA